MDSIFYKLIQLYKRIIHGIAFVPLLITIGFIFTGLILSMIESTYSSEKSTLLQLLVVNKPETARAILTGIFSGMISLTVFSFSMMMVVVNQSSSNFSPKVVDTFINNRTNQFILGVYLGTIVFALMAMLQIDNENITKGVPNLSLIACIIFSVFSILLFVKFINNIARSVRIGSIVEGIYKKTKESLNDENGYNYIEDSNLNIEWHSYQANRSGYFQIVRIESLVQILKEEDLILKVLLLPGYYFTTRSPLFCLNKKVMDDKLLEKIRNTFMSYTGEDILDNDFFGFRQLREVAVKGLSPGINDPGVARLCIDYLGELLSMWMSIEKKYVVADDKGYPRLILNKYDFVTLMEICFTPIKSYAKKDYTVLIALLRTINDLSYYDDNKERKQALIDQASSIIEDADIYVENSLERNFVNSTIKVLNENGYFSFPLLKNIKPGTMSDDPAKERKV